MPSLAEYFELNRYKAQYEIGDRVYGTWNKIPFCGSVGNDGLINELEGPRITIHLDLPIRLNSKIFNVIVVTHKDVKRLLTINEDQPKLNKGKNVKYITKS